MIEPWSVRRSTITHRDRWLSVRSDDCVTSDGRIVAPYHVLEFPTWLIAVPLTTDGRLILVREYRHGFGRVVLGLPSGAMDPADPDEEAATRRELAEETGYTGGTFHLLGRHPANPANQTNEAVSFLAVGVGQEGPQELEPHEEIEVIAEPFTDVLARLLRGEVEIQVSHVAALYLAALALIRGEPGLAAAAGLDREALRASLLGEG